MPRSAVIINEFGATPIDQHLLRERNIALSVLSGGCLCCQVRDALIPVLKNLRMAWERQRFFDKIIIETSGIANPEQVVDNLLNHRWLTARLHLQAMITTVSAVMAEDNFDRFPEVQAQIAWADTIVITQTDLASDWQLEQLHSRLDQLAPAALRLTAIQGNMDIDSLLVISKRFRRMSTMEFAEPAGHCYTNITVRLEQPILWEHLQKTLASIIARYCKQLIRLKGLIYTPEETGPLLVQGVAGRLYPPTRLPARSSDDGIGRLIFISDGEIKDLAKDFLAQLQDHC